MRVNRKGSALLWVAMLLTLLPPAMAAATDAAAAIAADQAVGAGLAEAGAVADRAPVTVRLAVFRQAFYEDVPAAVANGTSLQERLGSSGVVHATATVLIVPPIPIAGYRQAWLTIRAPA
jgi:hypothetical protein